MTGMLEMADQEFKTTIINTLRILMDNINSMQEQMSNESRDGNPKKGQQKARDKKTLREMTNGFDELRREEKISELKNISIHTSKTKAEN